MSREIAYHTLMECIVSFRYIRHLIILFLYCEFPVSDVETLNLGGSNVVNLYYCESCKQMMLEKWSVIKHKLRHLTHKIRLLKYMGT
jgi:hypothetical protein